MSGHTPGPWVTSDGHGPVENGLAVESVRDGWLIASTTGYYGRAGAQANARLIAAAPELLEALQELVHWHAHRGAGDAEGDARSERILPLSAQPEEIQAAMRAIAKATGAQP